MHQVGVTDGPASRSYIATAVISDSAFPATVGMNFSGRWTRSRARPGRMPDEPSGGPLQASLFGFLVPARSLAG